MSQSVSNASRLRWPRPASGPYCDQRVHPTRHVRRANWSEAIMRTPFTDLIGCRLPIQQAGFDSLNIDLAAAVSEVGGLGMIGAPLVTAEALSDGFDQVREQTDAPVAVNFA